MSDPFRDAAARDLSRKRKSIREEYTPIVLWVKTPEGESAGIVRNWIQDKLTELPFVSVAINNEPYPYASDGVLREEDADSGGDANE